MSNLDQRTEIQYDGSNAGYIFDFAGPLAMEHWPDHLTLVFPERNVSIAPGDYLFKDREGKVVSGNPA